jgi:hypothetical protein
MKNALKFAAVAMLAVGSAYAGTTITTGVSVDATNRHVIGPPAAKVPDAPAPEAVAAAATASQDRWRPGARVLAGCRAPGVGALVTMDDAQRAAAVSQLLTALNEDADVVGPVL